MSKYDGIGQGDLLTYEELAKEYGNLCDKFKKYEKALKHIAALDAACSPCNFRCDYEAREHLQQMAINALKTKKRKNAATRAKAE